MYARIYFILLFLHVLSSVAADTKKDSMVAEWVALAHDLQQGTVGYFYKLPLDIQTNIFSRIHPAPSLDDWQSNNMLCVTSITVPHCIMQFDINGDRLAFMAPKRSSDNAYQPCWIDLNTHKCYMPCEEKCVGFSRPSDDSAVQLCGEMIFFEESFEENATKKKCVFVLDLFERPIADKQPIILLQESDKKIFYVAHKKKPLCAITNANIQGNIKIDIYDNGKLDSTFTIPGILGHAEKCIVTWHNKRNYLYKYDPSMTSIHLLDFNKNGEWSDYIKAFHIKSEPYFSPDGHFFYAKHKDGLLIHNIDSAKNTFHTILNEKNNFLLRGVGHSTYLAEITDDQGLGTQSYELRKFESEESVPLTELKNAPVLHKLPSSDDYRYVTVVPDKEKNVSTIEIFVPKTKVMFQHYCMLQAALAAQKSDDTKDHELFATQQQATLVQETKNGYPVFDHLMAKKVSKEQKGYA